MCSEELGEVGSNLSISDFTSTLQDIATVTIPRNKCKPNKHNTPWFNDECRSAVLDRRKALRKVKASPTAVNLEHYKISRAKARRTIRTARRLSWQTFVSKINSRTPAKKVWKMINKIAGKKQPNSIHHLKVNGTDITNIQDIANTLAKNSLTTHLLITTATNSVHIRTKPKAVPVNLIKFN